MTGKALIKKPLITEKATRLGERGTYSFVIAPHATKNEVKKAIHELYHVDVVRVSIVNEHGKTRRFRGISSLRSGRKKAMATLKEGQKIELA